MIENPTPSPELKEFDARTITYTFPHGEKFKGRVAVLLHFLELEGHVSVKTGVTAAYITEKIIDPEKTISFGNIYTSARRKIEEMGPPGASIESRLASVGGKIHLYFATIPPHKSTPQFEEEQKIAREYLEYVRRKRKPSEAETTPIKLRKSGERHPLGTLLQPIDTLLQNPHTVLTLSALTIVQIRRLHTMVRTHIAQGWGIDDISEAVIVSGGSDFFDIGKEIVQIAQFSLAAEQILKNRDIERFASTRQESVYEEQSYIKIANGLSALQRLLEYYQREYDRNFPEQKQLLSVLTLTRFVKKYLEEKRYRMVLPNGVDKPVSIPA